MHKFPTGLSIWIILCPILLIAALAVLLPLILGVGERPAEHVWKGAFYSNSDDPSLFVPKRYGVGLAMILIAALLPLALPRFMFHRGK